MASFVIVKVPSRNLNSEAIEGQVDSLLAVNDKKEFREGTRRDSFTSVHDCISFEAGFEYPHEIEGLDGVIRVKAFKTFQIAFIGDRFIAIGNAQSPDDLDWVKRFLEKHFVPEVVIELIELEDKVLRNIVENNPDVFEIEHTPTRQGMEAIDRLKYVGRGVTQSKIYEEWGEEPLEKIKVRLNEITEGITVAFYSKGKVTIFRETDPERLLAVLKLIVDRIIGPYVTQTSYQRRLF